MSGRSRIKHAALASHLLRTLLLRIVLEPVVNPNVRVVVTATAAATTAVIVDVAAVAVAAAGPTQWYQKALTLSKSFYTWAY